jgi:hypothetical protein
MITNILTVLFFTALIIPIWIKLKSVKKQREHQRKILEEKEEIILVEYRDMKIPMRREELPLWNAMNRYEKNQIYAAQLRSIKKKELYKMPDGNLIPYKEAIKLGLVKDEQRV